MNNPTCPWCGKTRDKFPGAHILKEWGSKVYVRNGRPRVKTSRKWRYDKETKTRTLISESSSVRLGRRYTSRKHGRYNMVICAHPFHNEIAAEPEPVVERQPAVHHPDLKEIKKKLKRDLQNKDRR